MTSAPVVVFAYNRPIHTARLLASLRENPEAAESQVYVYCDGPRGPGDRAAVLATRDVVSKAGLSRLEILERPANLGLAANIIDGVSAVCEEHGRAIVLEDDLVVSSTFLRFMNHGLDRYAAEERVYHVSGFMYPVQVHSDYDAVFLPFISSWGWGTWMRAWKRFDASAAGHALVLGDRATRRRFDLDGAYTFSAMLKDHVKRRNNSWAIRWYLSVFRHEGLALFPRTSLVENHGFGQDATHCLGPPPRHTQAVASPFEPRRFPPVGVDQHALDAVKAAMRPDATYLARGLRRLRRYAWQVKEYTGRVTGKERG